MTYELCDPPGAVGGEGVGAVPDVRRLVAVDRLAARRRAVPPLVHVAHQLGVTAMIDCNDLEKSLVC